MSTAELMIRRTIDDDKMSEFTEDMHDSTDLKVTHEMEVCELGEAGIPMHERRGRRFKSYGTGRIDQLMWHKGDDKTTCSCLNCKQSDSPSKQWMEVFVMTAKHVVYNDEEAKNTCCKLFYNNERSAEIVLNGISVDYEDKEKDRCLFKCATCDPDLMKRLDTSMKHFEIIWKKAYNKYKSLDVKRKLICIVSHPHGHFKMVSIGHALKTVKKGKVWFQYVYSTPTCPGSSGAATFVVGHTENFFYQHIHSHSNNNLNYSGLAW
ncbi:hypothetical protein Bpfe_025311 [Biomphalaria pfeifferi]|uniref:Uncharacterized protein n=1 Tax=Biomphalaria pfeifferi TaxID=112525 RepID=A0AAD8EYM1_BIOPF|nr:hypothetical protein Bpfe_025311 [Biomphalaria pfeifferi]